MRIFPKAQSPGRREAVAAAKYLRAGRHHLGKGHAPKGKKPSTQTIKNCFKTSCANVGQVASRLCGCPKKFICERRGSPTAAARGGNGGGRALEDEASSAKGPVSAQEKYFTKPVARPCRSDGKVFQPHDRSLNRIPWGKISGPQHAHSG